MARTPETFNYTVETLSFLSGWDRNRIYQDAHRENLSLSKLRDAAVWLAANATPDIRAEMARRLIPAILGARRKTKENSKVFEQSHSFDVMIEIFKVDRALRDSRARKIQKRRGKRSDDDAM